MNYILSRPFYRKPVFMTCTSSVLPSVGQASAIRPLRLDERSATDSSSSTEWHQACSAAVLFSFGPLVENFNPEDTMIFSHVIAVQIARNELINGAQKHINDNSTFSQSNDASTKKMVDYWLEWDFTTLQHFLPHFVLKWCDERNSLIILLYASYHSSESL